MNIFRLRPPLGLLPLGMPKWIPKKTNIFFGFEMGKNELFKMAVTYLRAKNDRRRKKSLDGSTIV